MDVARGKYSSCLEANAACPAPEFSGSAELILGIDGHLGGRKRTYWAFWLRERCSQQRVKRKSLIRPALPRQETAAGKGPHPRTWEASGLGERGEGSPARAANAGEMQSRVAVGACMGGPDRETPPGGDARWVFRAMGAMSPDSPALCHLIL